MRRTTLAAAGTLAANQRDETRTPAVPHLPSDPATTEADHRLPRTVVPSRYELTLEPNLEDSTFDGFESVTVEVAEPVDEVVVNAVELEIDEAWLEGTGGTRLDATVTLDKDDERAHLALSGTAQPGRWTLHARFRGVLTDRLKGFYRSRFTDESGAERVIAATQFEATDARAAFPCWDEPDLKAVFSVTLVVPGDLFAVSNTRVVSEEATGDGRRRVRFADSMVMSTYLVAFIVGPLEATEPVDVDGIALRVVHREGKGHLARYALEAGAAALRLFARYYGIPYPGDKCDFVALPDFAAGAMENIGCITFREVLLLIDPASATQIELQNVADVVNHELAHMWFGDLVTMKWWNGIWLNEAFATFMEMKATDAFAPDWERWVHFGLERSEALDIDALDSTRPVEYPVRSPREADGMFDVLTYQKGAAVLRMLEQYLGEEAFREGIRLYLTTHQYGNTETTDLWDAIEEATRQPTRRIMDSWIFQGGYPVVRVDSPVEGRVLRLRQERFRLSAEADEQADAAAAVARWAVPVVLRWSAGGAVEERRALLDGELLELDLPDEVDWVLVNAGGSGFYRVRYSPDLQRRLVARAQHDLEPLERYGIVDDSWAAVLAGDTTVAEFLDLVRGFADESDLAVWRRIAGSLRLVDRLVDDGTRPRFAGYVRALVAPALKRIGERPADGEPERTRELRGILFELVGVLGDDTSVQQRARELHRSHLESPGSVDPSLAAAALAVVSQTGGPEDYEIVLARFHDAPTPQEEQRSLYALADFPGRAEVDRTLELALGPEVRSQNAPFVIRRALVNRHHAAVAWEFVRRNWEALTVKVPPNSVVRMVEGLRGMADPAVANDVIAFFAEHSVPVGQRTLDQLLDRVKVNVALREREADTLAAGLP
jgi:puromycin-sensitive aminopeptidase